MDDLDGKVAVVTGAGSGMGKAFATRLAGEGMRVVVADIQQDALDRTVSTLTEGGHDVIGVRTDVSKPGDIAALRDAAMDKYGAVHVVCNNAGVEGYLGGAIWEAGDRDWEWTFGVNFWSVVHGIRAFVPLLLKQGEPAHIVNTASMTSIVRAGNLYSITKQAVLAASEMLENDLRSRGAPVGVTVLFPGTIATNLFHGERNRPTDIGDDPGGEIRERMHKVLAGGMRPETVAGIMVDAIRANRFYVTTDHEWDDRISDRTERILRGVNPS
jgi:NAD(P)-dependent dehydrogenase (short-subunit alcohol dehydrogenase family)